MEYKTKYSQSLYQVSVCPLLAARLLAYVHARNVAGRIIVAAQAARGTHNAHAAPRRYLLEERRGGDARGVQNFPSLPLEVTRWLTMC